MSPQRCRVQIELGIVEQELADTMIWFEHLMESEIVKPDLLSPPNTVAEELLKITVAAIRNTKPRA